MKKILILLITLAFIALMVTSCASTSDCASYGNNIKKYQKEVRY